jgi:hypothetical protein
MNDIFRRTFPNFDAGELLERLPKSMHPYLFKFIALFTPNKKIIAVIMDYLEHEKESEAWPDALRCIRKWKVLGVFFTSLVESVGKIQTSSEIDSDLKQNLRGLCFVFSNGELRKCIWDHSNEIQSLLTSLNYILTLLLMRLGLEFDGPIEVGENGTGLAESVPDECYVQGLELLIALRVYLSLEVFKEENDGENEFAQAMATIGTDIFLKITGGILISGVELAVDSLEFLVVESLFTLVSDMLSLHFFEGESFGQLVNRFSDATDPANGYGQHVRKLAFVCTAKIVASLAIDALPDGEHHPADPLIREMVVMSDNKELVEVTRGLIENLVSQQVKKKNMPWLLDTLSGLFVITGSDGTELDGEELEDDEGRENVDKGLHEVIKDGIVRISPDA